MTYPLCRRLDGYGWWKEGPDIELEWEEEALPGQVPDMKLKGVTGVEGELLLEIELGGPLVLLPKR
jgi:hypothetical protein